MKRVSSMGSLIMKWKLCYKQPLAADYEQIAEDARRLAEIPWPEGQIEDNCLSGKSQCWTKYGS